MVEPFIRLFRARALENIDRWIERVLIAVGNRRRFSAPEIGVVFRTTLVPKTGSGISTPKIGAGLRPSVSSALRSVSVRRTDLMALDRSPDVFAHRFYVLVLFFCFSYSYVRQTKLASSLVNFWAHYKTVCLIWFDLIRQAKKASYRKWSCRKQRRPAPTSCCRRRPSYVVAGCRPSSGQTAWPSRTRCRRLQRPSLPFHWKPRWPAARRPRHGRTRRPSAYPSSGDGVDRRLRDCPSWARTHYSTGHHHDNRTVNNNNNNIMRSTLPRALIK